MKIHFLGDIVVIIVSEKQAGKQVEARFGNALMTACLKNNHILLIIYENVSFLVPLSFV